MDTPPDESRVAPGSLDDDLDDDPLLDTSGQTGLISTGALPSDTEVRTVITTGYGASSDHDKGTVANYIPALAQAPSTAFGVCIAGVHGRLFAIGDAEQEFSIQSISKIFVFALVRDAIGPRKRVGSSGSTARDFPSTR